MKNNQIPSDTIEKTIIAKNVRHQRRRIGWTQEQLSENSGVAVRTIQLIENAKVEPHLQTLALLAGALEIEVHELSAIVTIEDAVQGGAADRQAAYPPFDFLTL